MIMAVDFVRAYHEPSNSDITVKRQFALAAGMQILDKPAVDRNGKPLPAKQHQPLGGDTAARRRAPKVSPAAPAGGGKADEATSTTEAN
jgi:hypothetical protein